MIVNTGLDVDRCDGQPVQQLPDIFFTSLNYHLPVLVANCHRRKVQSRTVRQVGGCDDLKCQILTDVVNEKFDGVAEQGKEDDQPVNLPWSGAGKSGIAKSSDCGMTTKLSKSTPDYLA